ncbi:MAG: hypothetical protein WC455_22930 [Dehalococcoidia bacterium]|jgi:hypothetical protein
MGPISQNVAGYLAQIGKPNVTKSTTTAKSNEGIDLGSLMMMLYLSDVFKKPSTESLGTTALGGSNPMAAIAGMAPSAASGGGGVNLSQLLQMLQSLGGSL